MTFQEYVDKLQKLIDENDLGDNPIEFNLWTWTDATEEVEEFDIEYYKPPVKGPVRLIARSKVR